LGRTCSTDVEDKKHIQIFGKETTGKVTTLTTEKVMGGYGCEDGR